MRRLQISLFLISVLGTVWWILTRRPRKVRRVFSWRRVYVRTLDFFVADVSGQKLFAIVLVCPFLPQVLGFGQSLIGLILSAAVSVTFGIIVLRRAAKWMGRRHGRWIS